MGLGYVLGLVVVLISYIVLTLCMNFLMSWCRLCMSNCFGLGTKVNPFLSMVFWVSDRLVFLASITSAVSWFLGFGLWCLYVGVSF